MTWVKVHNSMPAHPKLVLAGDRAAWLYVCGLCYANEHLTDGFIARHALVIAAPGVRGVVALAGRLVGAGLWHTDDGGWRIHDYAEHQRSAVKIRERRAYDANRKADARLSNGSPVGRSATSDGSPNGVPGVRGRSRSRTEQKKTSQGEQHPVALGLCHRLADHIRRNDPKADPKPDSDGWVREMRLLVDERQDASEVRRIIEWCQADPFWRSNILSPGKLRKQFTQLVLKAGAVADGNIVSLPRPSLQRANAWAAGYSDEEAS